MILGIKFWYKNNLVLFLVGRVAEPGRVPAVTWVWLPWLDRGIDLVVSQSLFSGPRGRPGGLTELVLRLSTCLSLRSYSGFKRVIFTLDCLRLKLGIFMKSMSLQL